MDPIKFEVHTYGCKVNTYDTGLIQRNMIQTGHMLDQTTKSKSEQLDKDEVKVHILNTCAVTAEATKEAVRAIRKIKARSPLSTVVVTGCAAQVDTDAFVNVKGADLVVANSHKGLLPHILEQYFKGELKERVLKSNIFRKDDFESGGGLEANHSRAFLKIQDGCNSFCTYCIIPYARGKSRSLPINDLVKRVQELSKAGYREIVLTGVHIGDYEDISSGAKKTLEDLIENLLLKTNIQRFRLTSLEPPELSDRLMDLYKDSRMCPHFHMSIQSANSDVLTAMRRNYSFNEVNESLLKINKSFPNAFVGMDVIAGFPTETEEQFLNTYDNLANLPWTRLHVFPYSERKGTRAATFDQIYPHVRKERAQKLRELSLHRYQSEGLKQISTIKRGLKLKNEAISMDQFLTRDYWTVLIENQMQNNLSASTIADEFNIKITGVITENSPRLEGVLRGEYV